MRFLSLVDKKAMHYGGCFCFRFCFCFVLFCFFVVVGFLFFVLFFVCLLFFFLSFILVFVFCFYFIFFFQLRGQNIFSIFLTTKKGSKWADRKELWDKSDFTYAPGFPRQTFSSWLYEIPNIIKLGWLCILRSLRLINNKMLQNIYCIANVLNTN